MAAVAVAPATTLPLDDDGHVAAQAGQRVGGVDHLGLAPVGDDGAGVAHLAARLGVERGAVEEDLDGVDAVVGGRAGQHGDHPRLGGVVGVADELGDAELLDHLAVAVEAIVVGDVRPCGPPWPAGAGRPSRC